MSKHQQQFDNLKAVVLIPTYNNSNTLSEVITSVLEYTTNILVVNDGCTDNTSEILDSFNQIEVLTFKENQGKGVGLKKGFERARALGYDHTISIDSDGQHMASDLPIFLKAIEENPKCLYVGARNMNSENVPGKSSFGNKFSNFWYKVNTGIDLPDTQSGYRSYPIYLMEDISFLTSRFEFEVEVLVKAAWKGIDVKPVTIDVYYAPADERISHFRTVRDFARITVLNTIFVTMALLYYRPKMLFQKLKKKSIKELYREYIIDANVTKKTIVFSVMLGLFIGITPLWGYQIILIVFFCHLLKLNKAIALVAGHISIPPMIPFILYGSYVLGTFILGVENNLSLQNISVESVKNNLMAYVIGAFSLATIASIVGGLITYLFLLFRKK